MESLLYTLLSISQIYRVCQNHAKLVSVHWQKKLERKFRATLMEGKYTKEILEMWSLVNRLDILKESLSISIEESYHINR